MIIRKKTLIIISSLLLISVLTSCLLYSNAFIKNQIINAPTIIIDAGHGGEDGGAVAFDGTLEKDINLSIAHYLKGMLELSGYNTIMIRETDSAIYDSEAKTLRQKKVSDIHNRFKIIENNPSALFVSIHQNKFEDSKYSGAQVFYSPNNPLSVDLAQSIQNSFVSLLQPENERQIKKGTNDVYLIYHTKNSAVLVECGFMSNNEELQKLKDEKYRQEVAFTIFCGINNYISNSEV